MPLVQCAMLVNIHVNTALYVLFGPNLSKMEEYSFAEKAGKGNILNCSEIVN